jgi:3alpha(or 20beta)-hydroxysteroid dehydrogenase
MRPMGRLDGKVAIITGGARGQGAAEGELFAAEGATVYLTDVLAEEGKATAAEIGGTFLRHDVTSEQQWDEVTSTVLDEAGRIDVLVNNAGIFKVVPMTETTTELWHQIMDVNALGVFLGMRSVAPAMTAQGSGSIVNISSVAGLRGTAMAFAYGASKWAVRGMTKSAAQQLAPHGVRVNSVHPGIIETQMLEEFGEGWRDRVIPHIPQRRSASAGDVARLVLFLASDDSDYANGAEFVIDGAMTA